VIKEVNTRKKRCGLISWIVISVINIEKNPEVLKAKSPIYFYMGLEK
jgi:hypothetical protein